MTGPIRIQRRRVKGWVMPENTVYVGRPTIFGNPFSMNGHMEVMGLGREAARRDSVAWFREWMAGRLLTDPASIQQRERLLARLPELRGKNLACWCSLGKPCHADVLLELANRQKGTP